MSRRKSAVKNKIIPAPDLREQYQIIRSDLLKLREDLQRGYDMAKRATKKKNLGQLFKR